MILGPHVIFSAYGFWLPNDPRGSWSDFVGSWELFRYGRATKTDERHSVAHRPHDQAARQAAKRALTFPPVRFSGLQARAIGSAFGAFARRSGLTVWACAILPDHVHLVLARHHYHGEQIVNLLKGEATRRLLADGLHPFAILTAPGARPPKCWQRGLWKVFIDSEADLHRAIRYVELNPAKEGKPPQRWSFVTSVAAGRAPLSGRG